ncbi:microcin C ABC transporter permease YejB [Minwuia thermotolerans]|uniref:Microcin ABC transporter permease n=1 Tax=Minwuia thermotolerans TaxID=2056226 RepID=A0A2M9G7C0_9PROT|nr:microcin C ABC transporter permease YejB [Minwuia thermotolerans]PJK31576.1 microcin ABC transporter permease [Minwuia thermotolerans]
MIAYLVRRILLIFPTLFAIMLVNFIIIQFAPGGPIEQIIAEIQGTAVGAGARVTGGSGTETSGGSSQAAGQGDSSYRGAQGLDPEFIAELEKQFGFDKPLHERFMIMLGNYAVFDFGESYFRDRTVYDLVLDKMPVSISLGLWSFLLAYSISIPLGIRKAVKDGQPFDVWTSTVVVIGYAIPAYLFAVLLIVLFAGGSYWQIFPLRGLVSEDYDELSTMGQIADYFWHICLPVAALTIGAFANLTMLTKNSFLDQINMQYVQTARAKGLTERRVLYGHVFRNAMLIIIAGFPSAFIAMLFTGTFLIEVLFSLDGLGRLGFESVVNRDYPVVFGTLYAFTLLGLVMTIIRDITYAFVDPRIDFERRDV